MCVIALPKHRLGRFSHNPEFPSERAGTGSEDLGLSLRPEFLDPSQVGYRCQSVSHAQRQRWQILIDPLTPPLYPEEMTHPTETADVMLPDKAPGQIGSVLVLEK